MEGYNAAGVRHPTDPSDRPALAELLGNVAGSVAVWLELRRLDLEPTVFDGE